MGRVSEAPLEVPDGGIQNSKRRRRGPHSARGVPDLGNDPKAALQEKNLSRSTDLDPTTEPKVRGKGE